MTAEIPKVRELDLAGALRDERAVRATTTPSEPADRPAGRRRPQPAALPPFADETMELPIFRELESAWFRDPVAEPRRGRRPTRPTSRSRRSPPCASRRVAAAAPTMAVARRRRTGRRGRRAGGSIDTGFDDTGYDDGWHIYGGFGGRSRPCAVRRLAESGRRRMGGGGGRGRRRSTAAITEGGLPQRVPMAQLVPGGVEKATAELEPPLARCGARSAVRVPPRCPAWTPAER